MNPKTVQLAIFVVETAFKVGKAIAKK